MRHGLDFPVAIRTLAFSLLLHLGMQATIAQTVIDWQVDNLTSIGGLAVTAEGGPKVIEADAFKAVEFDGEDDGLFLDGNPMSGATEFTIEIIFNPYSGGNTEQRFLHFQQDDGNRVLIELRIRNSNQWFMDGFVKSGSSDLVLYAEEILHPTDTWYNATLVYKSGKLTNYVDREEELSGDLTYTPVSGGTSSLGVRLNRVSYFKGAIRQVRVTHAALAPADFLPTNPTSISLSAPAARGRNNAGIIPAWELNPSAAFFLEGEGALRLFAIDGKRLELREAGGDPAMRESPGTMLLLLSP